MTASTNIKLKLYFNFLNLINSYLVQTFILNFKFQL